MSGQTTVDPERVTDAEDAIQDAFVRLQTAGGRRLTGGAPDPDDGASP